MTATLEARTAGDGARGTGVARSPHYAPYVAATAWYAAFIVRASGNVDGRRTFTLFDDAMISMTYARNLGRGHGLVWNAGGARVEGITNPLWSVVMAIPHLFGVPDNYAALVIAIVGAALCLVCGALSRAIVTRVASGQPRAAELAPWLVCFCYPLVYWTVRGMEVGFLTALLLASVLLALKLAERPSTQDLWLLGVAIAAGLFTRIDFAIFVPVLAIYLAYTTSAPVRRRAVGTALGSALAALLVQEIARFAYYGRWVPNTYTLKVANAPLLDRLDRGWRSVAFTLLVSMIAAAVFAGVAVWRRRSPALLLLVGCAAASAAYNAYVGGDAWEGMRFANRYLTPGLVLLLCAAAIGVCDFVAHLDHKRARTVVVSIAITAAALVGLRLLPGGFTLFKLPRLPEPGGQRLALLPLAGVLLLARPGAALAAVARRLVTLLAVGIVATVSLAPFGQWLREGAMYASDDLEAARTGAEVARFTTPDARLAVVGAGNIIYFAHRDGVDLLGKSDARVAAGPVHRETGFFPGHMKWNYAISIQEERPDVIVDIWITSCDDARMYLNEGYVLASAADSRAGHTDAHGYLVRRDSAHIVWDELATRTTNETAEVLLRDC